MSECRAIPDTDHFDRLFVVEHLPGHCRSVFGTSKRNYQIQLRSSIDNPTDATKNAIYFSKGTKAIDIDRLQIGSLRKQFLVCHELPPHWSKAHLNTTAQTLTQENHSCDAFVSTDAPCSVLAPVPHHRVLMERQHG